jgi:cytochrome P450
MQKALKNHSILSTAPSMFAEAGSWTMEVNLAGKRALWIADPEGVKTVLQTGQKDWRTADSRRDMLVPVFGQNIITSDGELWHETRSVMRPAFAKKYFENLSMLDFHVKRFLASLPTDGEKIFDLRPQFAKLTMDFSTNFLFGFSTNSLAENADAHGDAFGKAFDELQSALLSGQALGKLGKCVVYTLMSCPFPKVLPILTNRLVFLVIGPRRQQLSSKGSFKTSSTTRKSS